MVQAVKNAFTKFSKSWKNYPDINATKPKNSSKSSKNAEKQHHECKFDKMIENPSLFNEYM